MLRALLGRFSIMREITGGIDQREMRKCLREIADQALAARLVFLRQQADVIAQGQQAFEQRHRLVAAAEHQISVDQPKAAGKEEALACRQAVLGFLGVVAQHQTVNYELGCIASWSVLRSACDSLPALLKIDTPPAAVIAATGIVTGSAPTGTGATVGLSAPAALL